MSSSAADMGGIWERDYVRTGIELTSEIPQLQAIWLPRQLSETD